MTEKKTEPTSAAPTLELVEAARLGRFKASEGWPQALGIGAIAWLQAPRPAPGEKGWTTARRYLYELLWRAANGATLAHTKREARVQVRRAVTGLPNWRDDFPRVISPAQYRDVTHVYVTPAALAAWLGLQGMQPSRLVAAWFRACGVVNPDEQQQAPQRPPEAGKKWTPERLQALKACRDKHGTKAAAAEFGISPQRVRALLPEEKPKPRGHSVFTHRPR